MFSNEKSYAAMCEKSRMIFCDKYYWVNMTFAASEFIADEDDWYDVDDDPLPR